VEDFASLLDWRRQIGALHTDIRTTDSQAAHQHWQTRRNRLFTNHPQSALSTEKRAGFARLPV